MNIEKIIYSVVIIVVVLAVAGALYPTLATQVTNISGSGFGGTAMLVIVSVLYWVLISASVVLYMVKSFLPKMGGKQD